MAIQPMYHGYQAIGMFDGLDSEISGWKGGEVAMFTYVALSQATDKHAKDADDGYVSNTVLTRPVVTHTLVSGTRPLFLADEGIANYGTMFGTLVGGTAGEDVSGTVLGPNTAYASGKVTLWDKGIFRVSLDAVHTNPTTGLVPTNTTLAGGAALYATSGGLLTPAAGSAFEAIVVGRFIEFTSNGSLVTTPSSLVTTNAPFTWVVVSFDVET